jgi:hypothetical protein
MLSFENFPKELTKIIAVNGSKKFKGQPEGTYPVSLAP